MDLIIHGLSVDMTVVLSTGYRTKYKLSVHKVCVVQLTVVPELLVHMK